MELREHILRWLTVLAVAVGVPAAGLTGFSRVQVETDITSAMPSGDRVVASAKRILGRHPALDMVTVDLALGVDPPDSAKPPDPDRLVAAAQKVTHGLQASGLFDRVGTEGLDRVLPGLLGRTARSLPLLFDQEALASQVAPRLTPSAIRAALERNFQRLAALQGVGQAELMAQDPLDLRELVLARLAALNPAPGARIYKGQLLSADSRHVLLVADPKGAGSDTAQARALTGLLDGLKAELAAEDGVTLTAVGAYRAALDNETIVRADTSRAVWVATIGVALLLILCFPRPWLGLLALVPAVSGAAVALLVYSFLEPSISALALGFGGALITITVDHGIAYLQFLDRHATTSGRDAAREVRAVGLFAALTTVGAFLTLYLSGFEMLGQVGLFAALGVGLSFAFVHLVFPLLFPRLGPAKRRAFLPVPRLLATLTIRRSWPVAACAALLGIGLGLVGWPDYRVDLDAMNTVRPETLKAEQGLAGVWGDVFRRTYVMLESDDLAGLQTKTDGLAELLARQLETGALNSGFSPSQVLPGPDLAKRNLTAWRAFFTPERAEAVRTEVRAAATAQGFAPDAFDGFLDRLSTGPSAGPAAPEGPPLAMLSFLGVVRVADGWLYLGAVEPGPAYQAEAFSQQAEDAGLAVFDPGLFTSRLSGLLGDTFADMLAIIGLAVVILLFILFFDPILVGTALLPLAFALACTLGCMRLLGHPLDIPGLMLAIVVLGMGVDYALYFVRGQQRYFSPEAPGLGPVRVAVFLAAGSTLVGLGTLAMADHAVPRSAGLTTLLGIGFAGLGTFALLPPILNWLFAPRPFQAVGAPLGSPVHLRAVRARYRHLEPRVRLFARFKLRLDPMFPRLAELVGPEDRIARLLDVGCGLGLPAAWLLAVRPGLWVRGLEPDPERARVARRVLGERGEVIEAGAPELGDEGEPFDAAMMLDVVHHLDDADLTAALTGIRGRLVDGGRLVIRADVPGKGRLAWERWLEAARLRLGGTRPHFRRLSEVRGLVEAAGFRVELSEPTAPGREETWLLAIATEGEGCPE